MLMTSQRSVALSKADAALASDIAFAAALMPVAAVNERRYLSRVITFPQRIRNDMDALAWQV